MGDTIHSSRICWVSMMHVVVLGPGDTAGKQSTCPDEAQRSILGKTDKKDIIRYWVVKCFGEK